MKCPAVIHADEGAEYTSDERCRILELSNDADDPAVSIARARVAPGVTTKRHRLDAIEERYVVIRGTGRVDIEGLDSVSVSPGDVVRIPAGLTQRIANTGTEDLEFLCICSPRFEWAYYRSLE